MAATTVNVQMQQRRDTAAGWTSANPTLLQGELGFETDTKKVKIGDGSTAWSGLAYYAGFSISAYPLAAADIASNAITEGKIASNAVTADKIGSGAVTSAKLASNITISGNLTVNGTTTTIDTTTLVVEDKNIEIGKVSTPTDTTADGGGITLKGATDHTITWVNTSDSWDFSEHVNLVSGKEFKINGTSVLSGSTLGSGVTVSSLTSVGTITTGIWNGTAIATAYIANDAIDGNKIADDSINSEHYVDGSIDTAHIANSQITSAKIADGTIVNGDISATAAIEGTKIDADFGDQDLKVDSDRLFVDVSADSVGINCTPAVTLDINATDAVALPHGTTSDRPTNANAANLTGYIRFNTTTTQFEGHNGTAWASVGGGATGGGSDQWAVEHDNTITASYSVTANKNVISAGPLTINSGAVITVPSTSNWVIV